MKKRKVISKNNLPRYLPINHTLIVVVALKVFNAPDWVIGAVSFWLLLVWIAYIRIIVTEGDEIDIFEEPEPDTKNKTFAEKVKERLDK